MENNSYGTMALSRRFSNIKTVGADSTEEDTEDDDEIRLRLFGNKTRFKYSNPAKISFDLCRRDSVASSDDTDIDEELLGDLDSSLMEEFQHILSSCKSVKQPVKKGPLLFDKVFCDMNRGPLESLRASFENYCQTNKDVEEQVVPDKSELTGNILQRKESVIPGIIENGKQTEEQPKLESEKLGGENTDLKTENSKVKLDQQISKEDNVGGVGIETKDNVTRKCDNQQPEPQNKSEMSKPQSEISGIVKNTKDIDNKSVPCNKSKFELSEMKTSHHKSTKQVNSSKTVNISGDQKDNCGKSHSGKHKEKNHNYESKTSKDRKKITSETNKESKHSKERKADLQVSAIDKNGKKESKKIDGQKSISKSVGQVTSEKNDANEKGEKSRKDSFTKEPLVSIEKENSKQIEGEPQHTEQTVKQPLHEPKLGAGVEQKKTTKPISKDLDDQTKMIVSSAKSSEIVNEKKCVKQDTCKEKRTPTEKLSTGNETKAKSKSSLPSKKGEDVKKVKTYDITPARSFPLDDLLPLKKRRASEETGKENFSERQRKRHATDHSKRTNNSTCKNTSWQNQDNFPEKVSTVSENEVGRVFYGTVYETSIDNTVPDVPMDDHQDGLQNFQRQSSSDSANYGAKEFLMSHFISSNLSDIMLAINNGNPDIMSSLQEGLQKEIESNMQALLEKSNKQQSTNTEDCAWKPSGFYTERKDQQYIPDASGDYRPDTRLNMTKLSENLFNLCVQQCSQLVQTEEDKAKLKILIQLLKSETRTSLANTDTATPELEKQSAMETGFDSDSIPAVSSGQADVLFEGRTMLKGGVKPRHIPKHVVYKPGKSAPLDPRPYPRKPTTKVADIELPPFAIEMWGKEKYDKVVALGESSVVLSLSDCKSTRGKENFSYNATQMLQSSSSSRPKCTSKQVISKQGYSSDISLSTKTKGESVSLQLEKDSQSSSKLSDPTGESRSKILDNSDKVQSVIKHKDESKELYTLARPAQDNNCQKKNSQRDTLARPTQDSDFQKMILQSNESKGVCAVAGPTQHNDCQKTILQSDESKEVCALARPTHDNDCQKTILQSVERKEVHGLARPTQDNDCQKTILQSDERKEVHGLARPTQDNDCQKTILQSDERKEVHGLARPTQDNDCQSDNVGSCVLDRFSDKNWTTVNEIPEVSPAEVNNQTIQVLISKEIKSRCEKITERERETAPVLFKISAHAPRKLGMDQLNSTSDTNKDAIIVDSDSDTDKKSKQVSKKNERKQQFEDDFSKRKKLGYIDLKKMPADVPKLSDVTHRSDSKLTNKKTNESSGSERKWKEKMHARDSCEIESQSRHGDNDSDFMRANKGLYCKRRPGETSYQGSETDKNETYGKRSEIKECDRMRSSKSDDRRKLGETGIDGMRSDDISDKRRHGELDTGRVRSSEKRRSDELEFGRKRSEETDCRRRLEETGIVRMRSGDKDGKRRHDDTGFDRIRSSRIDGNRQSSEYDRNGSSGEKDSNRRSGEKGVDRVRSDEIDGKRRSDAIEIGRIRSSEKRSGETGICRIRSDELVGMKRSYETNKDRMRSDDVGSKRRQEEIGIGRMRSYEVDSNRRSGETGFDRMGSDEIDGERRRDKTYVKERSYEIESKRKSDEKGSRKGPESKKKSDEKGSRKGPDETACRISSVEKSYKRTCDEIYDKRSSDTTVGRMRYDEITDKKRSNMTGVKVFDKTYVEMSYHEQADNWISDDTGYTDRCDMNESSRRYGNENTSHRRLSDENRDWNTPSYNMEIDQSPCYTTDRHFESTHHKSQRSDFVFTKSDRDYKSRNYRTRHISTSSAESSVSSRTSSSSRQSHMSSKITVVTKKPRSDKTNEPDTIEADALAGRKRHHTAQDTQANKKTRWDQKHRKERTHSLGEPRKLGKSDRSLTINYSYEKDLKECKSSDFEVQNTSSYSSEAQQKGCHRERQNTRHDSKSALMSKANEADDCKLKEIPKQYQAKPSVASIMSPVRDTKATATLEEDKMFLENFKRRLSGEHTEKNANTDDRTFSVKEKGKTFPKLPVHGDEPAANEPVHDTKATASLAEDKMFLENFKRRLSGETTEENASNVDKTFGVKEKAKEREDRLFLESIKKNILEKRKNSKAKGQVNIKGHINIENTTAAGQNVLSFNDMLNLADLEAIDK